MPLEQSGYDTLQQYFQAGISESRNELERFCLDHCSQYVFEPLTWLDQGNLFRLLPLAMSEGGRLRTQGIVEYEDEVQRYIAKVHAFHTTGSLPPFAYVQEDIRDILINKQKLELLRENYARMFDDAMQRNHAEIY